jgi:hypothetical protein
MSAGEFLMFLLLMGLMALFVIATSDDDFGGMA